MRDYEIKGVVRKTAGSRASHQARLSTARDFFQTLEEVGQKIDNFHKVKPDHMLKYFQLKKAEGRYSDRTLANKASYLRTVFGAIAQSNTLKKATALSNADLGLEKSSRAGTHEVMPRELFDAAHAALPIGPREAMSLQRALGLRAMEAVRCVHSLPQWERQLERGLPVSVRFGTKGGRPRETHPIDPITALAAVRAARAVVKQQEGHLVTGGNELRSAVRAYQRALFNAGFKGSQSSHSARYEYARARYVALRAEGLDSYAALALVSMDLGHGDGRTDYVRQVYLKGVNLD
jgi:hypothetical protein